MGGRVGAHLAGPLRGACEVVGCRTYRTPTVSGPRRGESERIAGQGAGGDDSGGAAAGPIALLMSLLRFSGSATSTTTRW